MSLSPSLGEKPAPWGLSQPLPHMRLQLLEMGRKTPSPTAKLPRAFLSQDYLLWVGYRRGRMNILHTVAF